MSFDWKDYVYLAEELLARAKESCLRSSISRAYYGVFCIARNRKGYQNYEPKRGENIHWLVINEYKISRNVCDRDIGRTLDKLRKSRNDADYKENKPINTGLAERSVLLAKSILAKLGIA